MSPRGRFSALALVNRTLRLSMKNNTDGASSSTPSRRKTLPEIQFSPFCEGQDEFCNQQKRRTLIRVWVTLLITNMIMLIAISIWAVHRSHERERQAFGKCYIAPRFPEDRRKNKDVLSIVNFNAEWLFMRGGHGDIRCPSESCPWAVQTNFVRLLHKQNFRSRKRP